MRLAPGLVGMVLAVVVVGLGVVEDRVCCSFVAVVVDMGCSGIGRNLVFVGSAQVVSGTVVVVVMLVVVVAMKLRLEDELDSLVTRLMASHLLDKVLGVVEVAELVAAVQLVVLGLVDADAVEELVLVEVEVAIVVVVDFSVLAFAGIELVIDWQKHDHWCRQQWELV